MNVVVTKVMALLAAVLCVAGFIAGGTSAVVGLVLVGVAVLTCEVAAASKPRPLKRSRSERPGGEPGRRSPVLIGHQRDSDVVDDEGRQGEGVEDLVEAEPAR